MTYQTHDPRRAAVLGERLREASTGAQELAIILQRTLALAELGSPAPGRLDRMAAELSAAADLLETRRPRPMAQPARRY